MIQIFNRPKNFLESDFVVGGLIGNDALATYDRAKDYFKKMIQNGVWQKEGPSKWLVVRGAELRFVVEEEILYLRGFSTLCGINTGMLRRLLTIRSEWSKK